MVREGRRARLTVLGGAVPDERIREYFAPDARPFVSIRSRSGEESVIDAYRSHDVLAWPSTYEGFGMVLLEAMSQGLPAVATPVGCASAVVKDEQTGLLVPPRDPGALAVALGRLLDDGALRRRMSEAGRAAVKHLTWTLTAKRTLETYARAVEERPRRD
jgi:glycosyltransferase involved in cell wall biosynthesis